MVPHFPYLNVFLKHSKLSIHIMNLANDPPHNQRNPKTDSSGSIVWRAAIGQTSPKLAAQKFYIINPKSRVDTLSVPRSKHSSPRPQRKPPPHFTIHKALQRRLHTVPENSIKTQNFHTTDMKEATEILTWVSVTITPCLDWNWTRERVGRWKWQLWERILK